MAVRYCDKTMRRSNSRQRGSLLSERSMAPPSVQNLRQWLLAAARVSSNEGGGTVVWIAENELTNSRVSCLPPCFGKSVKWCWPASEKTVLLDHEIFAAYES